MKRLGIIICFASLLCGCNMQSEKDSINPLIGNASFVNKFGNVPDGLTNEDLRIATHLEYVESLLRQKNISGLSPELQQKRIHVLDLLRQYRLAEIFPRNYDYTNRKPCFIDKDGRICAVGYLVEQTAGINIAVTINKKHKYDKIYEMNDELVDNWIASSGLTKAECAMIQPTYGPPPVISGNYIDPEYGIYSAVLSGVNVSLSAINCMQLVKSPNSNTIPIIGLITGAGQIALGIGEMPDDVSAGFYLRTNESQKALSFINIGFGTTTVLLSTWNLIANKKSKPKMTSWNAYGLPDGNGGVEVAFRFAKTF